MLIKFKSKESGDFVMMSDVALPLLKMMGTSGMSKGAVSADELRASLNRLESSLAQVPEEAPEADVDQQDEEEKEVKLSLSTRASPLLEMLRREAAEDDGYVMWQVD